MLNATAVDSPSPVTDSPRHRPRKPRTKRRRSAVDELRIALNSHRQRWAMVLDGPRSETDRLRDVLCAIRFCQGYVSRDYPELSQLLKAFSDIGEPDAVGGAK